MWNIEQNEWRSKAIFISLLIVLAGLFVSRVVLTTALFAFLTISLLHRDFINQCRRFIKTPILVAISILFFVPLISGLWSSNMNEYLSVLRVKLPLLMLPLAFAGRWKLTDRQWQQLAAAFILLTVFGCLWSIWSYYLDHESINEGYLRAKTLPTPLGDDHVRFSWLVSIAVLTTFLLMVKNTAKQNRILLFLAVSLFVIYLHILSARTGLLILYINVICFCIYQLRLNKKIAVTLLSIVLVISVAAWLFFPTLKNRVRYNLYDISYIQKNSYRTGLSDVNRIISLKASWHILQTHPLGIGAGDIRGEMDKWYQENIPEIQEADKLYPSSEWMVYANMAGWPGIILFTLVMIFPVFIKHLQYRFFWVLLNLGAGLSFVIETSLEIQYGVFLYAFFVLCWGRWLKVEKTL